MRSAPTTRKSCRSTARGCEADRDRPPHSSSVVTQPMPWMKPPSIWPRSMAWFVLEDVDTKDSVLAGQDIDRDLRAGRAVGEVEFTCELAVPMEFPASCRSPLLRAGPAHCRPPPPTGRDGRRRGPASCLKRTILGNMMRLGGSGRAALMSSIDRRHAVEPRPPSLGEALGTLSVAVAVMHYRDAIHSPRAAPP